MNIFPMTEEYTPFDLAEKARRTLSDAGLVVEEVDLSGELVTCGTTKKPCGTDGRYAVHLDFPPNVWLVNYHEGGEGRTVPLYDRGTLDAMTAGEKEAMRERIRQEKEAARARREEERRGSVEKANRLFPTLFIKSGMISCCKDSQLLRLRKKLVRLVVSASRNSFTSSGSLSRQR